ncbi:MAG: type II toxin-antitoxin system HicB family antitoxin [Candidatus Thermoplasmatota archaeon]|jgi:predicted RNase H-like HicB family nuclease
MSAPKFSAVAAKRQVFLHRDEEGWWVAEVPSLHGCASQGKTRDEAIANIKDAIQGVEDSLRSRGLDIPRDDLDAALVVV